MPQLNVTQAIQVMFDDRASVWEAVLSPNGRWLGVRTGMSAMVLDLKAPAEPRRLGTDDGKWLSRMAFSPDSKLLAAAVGDARDVRLWDTGTWELIAKARPPADQNLGDAQTVASLDFSPDGRRIAIGPYYDLSKITYPGVPDTPRPRYCRISVSLWDADAVESGESRGFEAAKPFEAVWHYALHSVDARFSPDGRILATTDSSPDRAERRSRESTPKVIFWDAQTRKELHRLEFPNGLSGRVFFSPDGKQLALTAGSQIEIWDIAKLVSSLPAAKASK